MLKETMIILLIHMFMSVYINAQEIFWDKSNKPEGGVVYSLHAQNDTLIIGTKGGLYLSEDLGETWTSIGLQTLEVWSVSICAKYIVVISSGGCYRKKLADTDWEKIKDGHYQTLATKDSLIYLGSGYSGVYRSKDCGQNWEQINNGINNYDIEKIHITASNVILASAAGTSGSGVFRSLDFGDNWSRIDPYEYAWNFQGISELNNVLYAFDFNNTAKVYKSVDDGLTWFLPSGSMAPSDIINSIYVDNSAMYVGVQHYGFFRSNNEGASWSSTNSGLKNFTISEIGGNSSELFLGTYDGFFKAEKSTKNWKKFMSGISDVHIHSISQNSDYIFVGSYGSGLFRADKNLTAWKEMQLGQNYKYVSSVLALDEAVYVLISSWTGHWYQELFVSSNNGDSWSKLNPNFDSAQLETIVGNNNVLFVGSGYGVFRSTNSGNSWEKMSNGMPNNINTTSVAVHDSVVIVTNGTSGVYRSIDLGDSWVYNTIPELFSGTAISVSDDGIFYLGSGSINRLFKSEDFGKTWSKLNNPLYNSSVNSISVDGDLVICGLSNNGIIVSLNGGNTWAESNLGIQNKNIDCVSTSNSQSFVGTNSGFYKGVSSKITPIVDYPKELNKNSVLLHWKKSFSINKYRLQVSIDSQFQSIILDQEVSDTAYSLNKLDYMKTYYWRVSTITNYWDNKFSEIQKVVISNPLDYMLYNNYPNPFNNETNIRVDVPYKSEISLVLFNILGEQVKKIENSVIETGSYYYKIEADNLASGIYFIRLVGQNFSQTKKALLLK